MNGKLIVAAGSTFVGFVLGGFAAGIVLANRTGASWWVIAGVFAGLALGMTSLVSIAVRATK